MGLVSGASLVFFAFIGFDVVATTAEEAKNPQRDLPRGIIGSLAICTVLYVLVCIVITGMVKYTDINGEAALAEAFRSVGRDSFATLISAGAVAGLIGMPTLLNDSHQFSNDFPSGIGFTGIAIALLGRNNPVGIALGALLWGFLERTTNHLEFEGYDKEILGVIQGVIVLCVVIAYELVRRYGLKRQQQRVGAELAAQAAAPTQKQEVA